MLSIGIMVFLIINLTSYPLFIRPSHANYLTALQSYALKLMQLKDIQFTLQQKTNTAHQLQRLKKAHPTLLINLPKALSVSIWRMRLQKIVKMFNVKLLAYDQVPNKDKQHTVVVLLSGNYSSIIAALQILRSDYGMATIENFVIKPSHDHQSLIAQIKLALHQRKLP